MNRLQAHRSSCSDPLHERELVLPSHLETWAGLPVSVIGTAEHEVRASARIEHPVLVMLDRGSVLADTGQSGRRRSYDLAAGSIGFFPAGSEFHCRWRWKPARRVAIALDLTQLDSVGEFRGELPMGSAPEFEFRDKAIEALIRAMVDEVLAGSPHGSLYAQSMTLGLALGLRTRSRSGLLEEKGRLTPAQMMRVHDLLNAQLGRDLSVQDLAQAAGFSPTHFVRLFRNTVGCSPYQYVLRVRLERARREVSETRQPLSVIAQNLGFSSQSHMTAAFTRTFGCAPGELRRRSADETSSGGIDA